jgi:hypothetical protein
MTLIVELLTQQVHKNSRRPAPEEFVLVNFESLFCRSVVLGALDGGNVKLYRRGLQLLQPTTALLAGFEEFVRKSVR